RSPLGVVPSLPPPPSPSLKLVGYVDAADAGDKQNRTSTGGYVFVFGVAAVSWTSQRIKCATLSSTESEYVAATEAGKEGRRLRFLLAEFRQLDAGTPTVLRVDNKLAIIVAEGMGLMGNLKHMERQQAWLQHMVKRGKFSLRAPTLGGRQLRLVNMEGRPVEGVDLGEADQRKPTGCGRLTRVLVDLEVVDQGSSTAEATARLFFDRIITIHGIPATLISDRDPKFMSKFWKELMGLLGTKLAMSSACHPQIDGQTERLNQVVEQLLRTACKDDVSHWDTQLPTLEFAYNNASHAATGKTPFFLCYGREPLTPQQPTTPAHVQAAHDFVTTMKQLWEKTQRRLTMMQNSQKQYADRQRRDHSVAVGDQVLLDMRNLNLSHLPSKLRPRFCGPFLVEAQVTPVTFRLRLPDTWKHHNAFHVQLLKPYKDPNQQFQGRQLPPPPPVLIQHEPEYEVERVLTHRRRGGKTLEFLLRWKGYDRTEDSWVAEADMGNARHPHKPRSLPVLYVDKKAMIALCQEHRLEHQTKPIALWYFLARDLQQRGQLRLAYMATRANTAGVFTKALPPSDHQRFATVLGLVPTLPHFLTA
ncbi:unnamed protein product, partial [Closterium sp. NIES-54]